MTRTLFFEIELRWSCSGDEEEQSVLSKKTEMEKLND